jgi:hypothetical protein
MEITEEALDHIRFFLEVQYREKLVHKPEFPFLQSIGMKDIFQGFKHPSGKYLGMLHLKWSSGKTWLREGWFDSKEEAEDFIRKLYEEKPVDTEKLYQIHYEYQKKVEEKIRAEQEMEILLDNGDLLWN